jgi:hypothetical protein
VAEESGVTKIEDVLPSKEEYDPETESDSIVTLACLHDLREIGVLENGEPINGEEIWYLTETGVAWAEGDIELSLKELAENEEVSEDDLYQNFSDLKKSEKIIQAKSLQTEKQAEGGGQ